MHPITVGTVVFICTFGAAIGGISLRRILPEPHLSSESRNTVNVGVGLIATMSALVLGLVTASAKSSFDAVNTAIKQAAADVLSLDRVLAQYGSDTEPIRASLKRIMTDRVELMWHEDSRRDEIGVPVAAAESESLAAAIRRLSPQTDEQRFLKSRASSLSESLLESRWAVLAGLGTSIPVPFIGILLFWLTITFASFGLFAPRNATVVTILLVCALSVAGAVVLVLEMETPFEGLITVSPAPMKYALSHLNQ